MRFKLVSCDNGTQRTIDVPSELVVKSKITQASKGSNKRSKVSVKIKSTASTQPPKKGPKSKTHFEINVYRETDQERKPLKLIYGSGPKKDPGNFRIIVRGDS